MGTKGNVKSVRESFAAHSLCYALGVAVITSWADLGATRNWIPRVLGPLDFGVNWHYATSDPTMTYSPNTHGPGMCSGIHSSCRLGDGRLDLGTSVRMGNAGQAYGTAWVQSGHCLQCLKHLRRGGYHSGVGFVHIPYPGTRMYGCDMPISLPYMPPAMPPAFFPPLAF